MDINAEKIDSKLSLKAVYIDRPLDKIYMI